MSWRLILTACAGASLLFTGQVWLDYAYAGVPVSWPTALAISASDWLLWAPLMPLVAWLGRTWPIERRRWLRGLLVHVPVSLVMAGAKVSVSLLAAGMILGGSRALTSLLGTYVALLTYWAILGVSAALDQSRERRQRELQAVALEAELSQARLDALRMRLHPHFLFNTLNSIGGLMRDDVEAADLMLTRLSDLLRLTLDRADRQEVPLRDELHFAQLYLGIQQARFGDRLTVAVDADDDALGMPVPSLMLQPIIENAFQHGIADKPGAVSVSVRAVVDGARLHIAVEDNGVGLPSHADDGVGLSTTRSRLAQRYGADASVTLDDAPGGGTRARLTLPAVRGNVT